MFLADLSTHHRNVILDVVTSGQLINSFLAVCVADGGVCFTYFGVAWPFSVMDALGGVGRAAGVFFLWCV